MTAPIDHKALRAACGTFATGVTVISTRTEDGDHGMTANAFMSVSLDPPLVTISLDHKAKLLPKIRASGRYAVSILAEGMESLAWHFAGKFNQDHSDPFEDCEDLPVVPGAMSVFVTEVVQEVEAGDHTLFIGRVTHLSRDVEKSPLLFHGGKFAGLAKA